ncbi:MAG: TraB/GumN family protein [Candidatus Methanoplasma sp.]|jgi:pheromone shutdown protein TraB|nr:TraB/GumN family protein [Candidatus Methanoplasma sp.]
MSVMITMVGTGHVFKIFEQVAFIVKYTWPDAVLVELDERRYAALTCDSGSDRDSEDLPRLYRETAEYQDRMSKENEAATGSDMLAAIQTGRAAGADIVCIDMDAEQTMREVEEGMSSCERMRYSVSSVTDRFFGRERLKLTQSRFAADEEKYVRKMRRRFPTLVEKLIDERNEYMAERIREASEKYKNMVVVVGDAHVKGICEILEGIDVYKIRLADMMDQERMNDIKSSIWNRKAEAQEWT